MNEYENAQIAMIAEMTAAQSSNTSNAQLAIMHSSPDKAARAGQAAGHSQRQAVDQSPSLEGLVNFGDDEPG